MQLKHLLAVSSIAYGLSLPSLPSWNSNPIVSLPQGQYKGAQYVNTFSFKGIPYAQPPLGDLRFKAPLPITTTSSQVNDATNFGNACITRDNTATAKTSEDCLNLDIYTPVSQLNSNKTLLPVMVYIFGGGFDSGSTSAGGYYNGANIINFFPDVVIVAMNYRLNAFGFLAGTELEAEGSLNVGLLDQKLAFEWVQSNIEKFGGDPNQVTGFGQSAGSISIGHHLLSNDGNQTLFHRAIMQSGTPGFQQSTATQKQASFELFASASGCTPGSSDVMTCLRSKPASALKAASDSLLNQNLLSYEIVYDGSYVVQTLDRYSRLAFSKVPIIINTNQNEGLLQSGTLEGVPILNQTEFLSLQFQKNGGIVSSPDSIQEQASFYNSTAFGGNYDSAFAEFFSDWAFHCPGSFMAKAYQAAGVEVYQSRFNHVPQLAYLLGARQAFHGSDVIFVWQYRLYLTPLEWSLADKITQAYISFALGNAPISSWSTYGSGSRINIESGNMEADDDWNKQTCQFFGHQSELTYNIPSLSF